MATVSHSGEGGQLVVYTSNLPPTPNAPWDLVTQRFAETLAKADEFRKLLVGADGQSGYLGSLANIIQSMPDVSVVKPAVNTSVALRTVGSAPVFNAGELASYPNEVYSDPALTDGTPIDTSVITIGTAPSDINPSLSWSESAYTSVVLADLIARILSDLQAGATGLDPAVEAAIFARAQTRNQTANNALYLKLDADIRSRRFSMPSGALAASLVDFNAEVTRQNTDASNQIVVTSADLAQKNSQFIITQAVAVEQILRGTREAESNRALDFAKSTVEFLLRDYAERVNKYRAGEEAKKNYVQAMAENLRATAEDNKNKVEIFKEKYAALAVRIEGIAKRNQAIVDTYEAEVQGYGEEAKAYSAENAALIERVKMLIEDARLSVEAQVQNAKSELDGYTAEYSLREKVSNDLAQIAEQGLAACLAAVNANANLGYQGSESKSESMQQSVGIHENHSYPHDPLT